MKIDAITSNPQGLLTAINKAINEGTLRTWRKLENKNHETLYSHSPEQWDEKVLLKPSLHDDRVTFSVTWWNKNTEPTKEIMGYVVGRFTEVLLVHFRNHLSKLETTV